MKLLQSKLLALFMAFVLGGVTTYFITDYIRLKSNKRVSHIKDISDPFEKMNKIHDQMRRKMDRAFDGDMLGGSLFGNGLFSSNLFDGISFEGPRVEQYEDDDFKYVEVLAEGIDKDSININIADGMISVSGKIKEIEDKQSNNSRSMSSYVSNFSQSFSIPHGVNKDNAKFEVKDKKIVIKFPKERT